MAVGVLTFLGNITIVKAPWSCGIPVIGSWTNPLACNENGILGVAIALVGFVFASGRLG